ncbi:MAG: DNA gyrase subunit A [Tetrasphaera sp.]|uniref:DNA gyrase subunit A n=1 Tax=Phycicoccus elongatus TaxID=101689 RepID=UPI001D1F7C10|nr:DNA gyrase subunit A [Phycicoccus elongatus]MCB1239402.1 DNA gyrase subunit A [Tetrasphaera sp.]HPQ73946.1 DNA gyrase subunit A [Phycicoccus elongatus]
MSDDDTTGTMPPETDRVEPRDLNTEMQQSYIEYAMSVIVSRALPDVRDGLKPVHRRVLYAMWDGGYRPDRGFNKCSRVVGDVMGQYHPHGDSAIYDALVRLVQDWSMRYPLVDGQGNFGSPGDDPAAAPRYTECKMAQLSVEMVRDIDQNTVDFKPNYDGKTLEPEVLPSRFPNLLVNGSSGIAVGMATQIPPHNLVEVSNAAQWVLEHPDASREETFEAVRREIKGPDFPTGALIMGQRGIDDAYRTGRGSIIMRAVVQVEEIQGRQCLVVTELPYQVNPDSLAQKIAEQVRDGRLSGIADIRDETSGRTGQRLVIVLKKDAVAKVVLNNLYKHTQLQTNFGANMLALVDGVPRTLPIDAFIRHWVEHQIQVIQRRTAYRLDKAEKDIHILRGLLKALDMLDEVIALIRRSRTVEAARDGLIELLDIDEVQARAILEMQLRKLAALEREKTIAEHDELQRLIDDYQDILAKPGRQRSIVSDELAEIVKKFGDERRTQIVPFDGDMSMEDLIPEEDVVVTITRGGYAKRTRVDQYRLQGRGGKGVRGASLRGEDLVEHFFATTSHHWLLFFTNLGRVYRAKAYELPDAGRDAKGMHVANIMAFQPGEQIAQVLALKDYAAAPYLVLATKSGVVKKTRLTEYDSPRSGGLIAVNLRDGDELVGVDLVSAADDLLLISRKGMSVRFHATDAQLRPMGRSTTGVTGMKFKSADDELLSMSVIREGEDPDVFVVFENGMAKRTASSEWDAKGRATLGVKVANLTDKNGDLVGGLTVDENDQVLVVFAKGNVVRMAVKPVTRRGRNTQGMGFAKPGKGDSVVAVARNVERSAEDDLEDVSTVTSDTESPTPGTDDDGGKA